MNLSNNKISYNKFNELRLTCTCIYSYYFTEKKISQDKTIYNEELIYEKHCITDGGYLG